MIEIAGSSAQRSTDLLRSVHLGVDAPVPILEVITDHGLEFINTQLEDRLCLDHTFKRYLNDNDIKHTLCKVGRPQSNWKIERLFQTYDKHCWQFGTLREFLTLYNEDRPHMSLDWDNLESPAVALDRLLLPPPDDCDYHLAIKVSADE